MTAFVRSKQSPLWLKLSTDRKVSPRGTLQVSRNRWVPTVPNSFGLTAGESCPGKTEFCKGCYAAGNEAAFQGVAELVGHNLKLLRDAGDDVMALATLLAEVVQRYVDEADRINLPRHERIFRIHWDGDFYSLPYARAWAAVATLFPEVTFWAYTRSFRPPVNVVPVLADVANLVLYLSVDEGNVDDAGPVLADHPTVLVAGCARDYNGARALLAQLGRDKPLICPENAERMKLMDHDPDDTWNGVGACVTCKVCPEGRRDILFSTDHVEDAVTRVALRPSERRICAGPDCDNPVPLRRGAGRPRLYCSTDCRYRAHWARQKATVS